MIVEKMEKLLHYIWKNRLYDNSQGLKTTDGKTIEVIDPGKHNHEAGPDFFNAKIKIGDILWAGNIEIHEREEDWFLHRHNEDKLYDNTILHVVEKTTDNKWKQTGLPTLVLTYNAKAIEQYKKAMSANKNEEFPCCRNKLSLISEEAKREWLDRLLDERIDTRVHQIEKKASDFNGDWERTFFITLSRNLGFGVNGDCFEQWAMRLPLENIVHHRDNIFQVEAYFFGCAGLLDEGPRSHSLEAVNDNYRMELKAEYEFLRKRYNITNGKEPIGSNPLQWRFMRMRPQSFPHIRIAQMAYMYAHRDISLSSIIEKETVKDLETIFTGNVSEYWKTHYAFGAGWKNSFQACERNMSRSTRQLIIINSVVPMLVAYGRHQERQSLIQRAKQLLHAMPAERNKIIRMWTSCGIKPIDAADSQALIQLTNTLCNKRDCLRCLLTRRQ